MNRRITDPLALESLLERELARQLSVFTHSAFNLLLMEII